MIRKAEQIITSHNVTRNDPESDFDWLVNLIKEAQIEAIKECAEIATTAHTCAVWNCEGESVDKQSILKLIDQIK